MIAIDLGSNTLRVLKYDCDTKQKLFSFQKMVKTADKVKQTKNISDTSIIKIIDAIKEVQKLISFENEKVVAVTTAAMRMAENSNDVILKIFNQTGVKFEIIDGDFEAYLTFKAVYEALHEKFNHHDDFILIYIGGGSTEVVISSNSKFISKSFDLGIVTLSQKYHDVNLLKESINHEMVEIKEFFKTVNIKPKLFVANSGTPTTIAAMKLGMNYYNYDEKRVSGTVLTVEDINNQLEILLSSSKERREQLVGIGRDDLIIAGVNIFLNLLEIANFKESFIIDEGLREGVAIEYCKNLTKK
ncbi:MAG: phosphatase [Campylobacterales bacterium]|nr:phosphatase [Campylobacterales bacterium]